MGNTVDMRIPDIGDSEDVEIIEILVSVGDTVEEEQSLLTLESDKASMEVPASAAGRIASLSVSVGDTANSGDVIGTMEVGDANAAEPPSAAEGAGDSSADASGADSSSAGASASASDRAPGISQGISQGTTPGSDSGGGQEKAAAGASSGASAAGATIDVAVPDIGDSSAVEVIEVLVAVGDTVTVEQSLITLESDKASMEVPSPAAGKVVRIDVKVGDAVDEGSPLLVLEGEGTGDGAGANGSAGKSTSDTGKGESPGPSAAQSDSATSNAPAAASASSATASRERSASPTAHISDEAMRRAHASPGVRRYAREHGADLSLVKGSGPKSRIIKDDVIAFIKQAMEGMGSGYGGGGSTARGLVGGGAGIPPVPEVDFSKFGETERLEMSRINKLSAKNLHRTWLNLPMVTHHDSADVSEMEAFRKQLKNEAREGDPKVTGLAFHMKALAATLKAFPRMNSSLSGDGESLILKKYFHIGIAVDTPNGLVVPVFRDVDRKSINQLADEMSDMSSRARAKKLKPDEMQGASMTISSLGGIGGTAFTPIVNAPEVGILGITRATMQPVWDGKEFKPRLMCPLDLSYDHRVIDGAEAARFMAHYVTVIGDVRRLLL